MRHLHTPQTATKHLQKRSSDLAFRLMSDHCLKIQSAARHMLQINGQDVVFHGQLALAINESKVRFSGDRGLVIELDLVSDGTGSASVMPRFENGTFRIGLANFGSPLGMAVSGSINATVSDTAGRPGAWGLKYTVTCQTIGDDKPYRLVNLTVVEARLA